MKQIEYTEEQKHILDLIAKINSIQKLEPETIKALKEEFKIPNKIPTIRQYIQAHQYGAHNDFVIVSEDFPSLHFCSLEDLLDIDRDFQILPKIDKYYVVSAKVDCYPDQFETISYLQVEPKED